MKLDVVDLLDSLVRKSLMSATRSESVVRYGLLETIRQFGEEQLADIGESETAPQPMPRILPKTPMRCSRSGAAARR